MDVHIIPAIKLYLEQEKRPLVVRENIVKAIDLIGKAMHPSHLKVEKYTFKSRLGSHLFSAAVDVSFCLNNRCLHFLLHSIFISSIPVVLSTFISSITVVG